MRRLAPLLLLLATPATAGLLDGQIYPAPKAPLSLAGLPAGAAIEEVRTADGLQLKGLSVPGRPDRPLLLVFHGNGSSAADAARWFAPLAADSHALILAEYRGYSGNSGRPSEAGLAADADAFFSLATDRAAGRSVWVVGHSLGGGVALDLARSARLDAVVTIGTFTRLRDAAPGIARALIPDAFRNIDTAAALDEPWFLIHGTADETIPAAQGERLHIAAGKAGAKGASFVLAGADHHPDAALLRPVFAAIGRMLGGAAPSVAGLPETVHLVPFGQTQSLRP